MTKTLAIIGTGPGVGMAVAQRFGSEGFRVALLSRSESRLQGEVEQLAAEGIEAAAFPADVLQRTQLAASLARVAKTFGSVDVIEYSPSPSPETLTTPRNISVENAQFQYDYAVSGAITAVRAVLPDMLSRGDGGVLFTTAGSALSPVPFSSNFAIAASGLRSYAFSLNRDLAKDGIYVGILAIAGLVETAAAADSEPPAGFPRLPMVTAGEVADRLWQMYTRRDRVEEVLGDMDAVHRAIAARQT